MAHAEDRGRGRGGRRLTYDGEGRAGKGMGGEGGLTYDAGR